MANIQEGFKRITLVLSIAVAGAVFGLTIGYEGPYVAIPAGLVCGMGVWLLYFLILYIVKGFTSKKGEKD